MTSAGRPTISGAHQTLGLIGTSVSGVFLIIIGCINLVALLSICEVWREAQTAPDTTRPRWSEALESRGLFARLLRPVR